MVEGNTRWRYLTAYSVEFIEMMLVCWLLPLSLNTFPYIEKVQVGVPISFIAGIAIMMMYYQFFHPNRRQLIVTQSQEDLSLNVQKSVETLTPKLESSLEISGEQNTSQDLVSELLLDVEHEN